MAVGNPLADLFGHSPIRPIQAHMSKAQGAVELLPAFVTAAHKGNWERATEKQKAIVEFEREADKLKHSVRQNLPKSLFMPVSRSDLLELVGMQDRIANCSKDIAGLMLGRKMNFPKELQELYNEYLEANIVTCRSALTAIEELDSLMELGFSKRQVHTVEAKIRELAKLEKKTDKLQIKLRGRLFKLETDLPPVEVMFLYKVIDLTGDLADYAEKVGHRLLILISV